MRKLIYTIALLFCGLSIWAQEQDTTIYLVAEQAPLFPLCAQLDTTFTAKVKCSQEVLLGFVYKNVEYPVAARQEGLEGTVVVRFVVEPDSTISTISILKDIGGGCGDAVVTVINAMNPLGVRWAPGKNAGKAVRTQMTLPIKFKLEEPLPYVLSEGDTIYTQFDTPLAYKEGEVALEAQLKTGVNYPEIGNESCATGAIDVKLLVQSDGIIKTLNVLDYNNLGLDFQLEAINFANSTSGKWNFATYKGKNVSTTYDVRLLFLPTDANACKQTISDFDSAKVLAEEGAQLYSETKLEESIAKFDGALQLFPNNAEFLSLRGQAHMEMNNFEGACADLSQAAQILGVNWYDSLLMIICNTGASEE